MDGARAAVPRAHREARVLVAALAAEADRVAERRRGEQQRHRRVARAERREPAELLGEREPDLLAGRDSVDALDRDQVLGRAARSPRAR